MPKKGTTVCNYTRDDMLCHSRAGECSFALENMLSCQQDLYAATRPGFGDKMNTQA